jgi:hypothetical protein
MLSCDTCEFCNHQKYTYNYRDDIYFEHICSEYGMLVNREYENKTRPDCCPRITDDEKRIEHNLYLIGECQNE